MHAIGAIGAVEFFIPRDIGFAYHETGTPVAWRLGIASTDYVAADRVGVEAMGINPEWMGYLRFCSEFGVGQYDLAKIDIRGEKIEAVRRKYQFHQDIERELRWMGPMLELPTKPG
jgi:uncharacterized protein (DUF362 family)